MFSIEDMQAEAHGTSEEEFIARHTLPAFVIHPGKEAGDHDPIVDVEDTRKIVHGKKDMSVWLSKTYQDLDQEMLTDRLNPSVTPVRAADLKTLSGATHLVFVRKDLENPSPFPNMITLGRAPNNDIQLPFTAVSKVHACVLEGEPGEWFIRDQHSTNGTWLNSARLTGGAKKLLEDGAWLNLGATLGLKFLLPNSLYGFLRYPAGGLWSETQDR